MPHHRRFSLRTVLLGVALGLAACSEDKAPSESSEVKPKGAWTPSWAIGWRDPAGAIAAFPPVLDRTHDIQYDVVGEEPTDDQLTESVRSRNGAVIIGFKPDDAPPSRSTGIAKGMTAEQVVQARERLQAVGVQITMTYSSFPAVAGIVSPERVADLRRQPFVDYVVVNGASIALAGAMPASLRAAHSGETGYFFTDTIDWGLTKIGAPLMWTFTGGNGATITMIDSGVDSTHLFSGDGPANSFGSFQCLYANEPPHITTCYQDTAQVHGSRVGGILAARSDGSGYIGVAPDVAFNSIRFCSASGGCTDSGLLGAINWTTTSGIARHVVNLSVSHPTGTTPLSIAVAASSAAGNLLVAANGNNEICGTGRYVGPGVVCYPALYSSVVAVSGTTSGDAFASSLCGGSSNYGSGTDIAAPFEATNMAANGAWSSACGTSFATPHVAGTAALVWAYNTGLTAAQVRTRLTAGALDLGTAGIDNYFGSGRVRAPEAVLNVLAASISGPSSPSGGSDTWTASATNGVNPLSYAWERKGFCDASFYSVGTNSASYNESTTVGDKFYLRVTITSHGRSAVAQKLVGGFAVC